MTSVLLSSSAVTLLRPSSQRTSTPSEVTPKEEKRDTSSTLASSKRTSETETKLDLVRPSSKPGPSATTEKATGLKTPSSFRPMEITFRQ